jgi:cell division protein FtsW
LIVLQPNFSSAILLTSVAVAMFFLAGADLIQFAVGLLAGGAMFSFLITRSAHASARVKAFIAAWQDPLTGGSSQSNQALNALGSGGVFGVGPGNGRMKFGWLPMPHNDGLFAIIGEELGLVGCLIVVGLFAFVAYRGFRIASRIRDPYGTLLASGITCWITFQALIHIAMNIGAAPVTGIPLPFMSAGGSSLVFCLVGVGLLLSVSRTIGTEADEASIPAGEEASEDDGGGRWNRRARVSRPRRAGTVAD